MRAKSRGKKLLLNGCNLNNTYIYYLCVITGNILFTVVPKLGKKKLLKLIWKIYF